MINVSVNPTLELVKARFTGLQQKIAEGVYKGIFKALIQLQGKIVSSLAAGEFGLKSRHGMSGLAGSVQVIPPQLEGDKVVGKVSAAGGPSWYGKMWELEGHGEIVPVTKKALAFIADDKQVFVRRVSAQSPRPWVRPAFEEIQEQLRATVAASIREAVS